MDPRGCTKMVLVLVLASSLWAQSPEQSKTVSPVTGESWLTHLHRSFDETSMGKTGRLGPPHELSRNASIEFLRVDRPQPVTIHGADLYRWNCRGCHGESGLGAPPEINSVINPVRSSSAALVMERMKKVGMDMSRAEAANLARQSHEALLQRLHNGGQDMPAFPHLNEREIGSLVAYLRELADVPNAAGQQIAIDETPERIGEQIVKSTCHVCHSASGSNPEPAQLAAGAIPPLSTLTGRVNKMEFIQKVTLGAPIAMGDPGIICRGRMPVFDYLSQEEVADAYLYLTRYPPYQFAIEQPVVSVAGLNLPPTNPDPPQGAIKASLVRQSGQKQTGEGTDVQVLALLTVSGLLVSILLGGAVAFSVWECMRLSRKKNQDMPPTAGAVIEVPSMEMQDRLSA